MRRTPTAQDPLARRPAFAWWSDVFLSSDDASLSAAGRAGELLVAKVRLGVAVALLSVPILALTLQPVSPENLSALVGTITCLVSSIAILAFVRRDRMSPSLPMATSLFDVTIVSATMLSYLLQGMPSVTVNGRTTFLAYFIAIGAACLRWDPRICLTAGVTAVVQYTGLVAAAWQTWPDVRTDDVLRFGQFQPGLQFGKLMLLVIFTFLCVVIVHQSRRLRISATHDPLTGLMNRAYFEERLGDELSRAGRHETPLCVALVDIDHFKRVNDTHGHPAGDAALRVVGRVLRRSLRRTDLVSRWGGEEFAIAFPETRLAEAVGKLEQLRLDVASHAISLSTGAELQLTISAGVAATRLDGVSLREIVDAADARLLEAKRAGRNRTVAGQPARAVSGEWRATVTEANS